MEMIETPEYYDLKCEICSSFLSEIIPRLDRANSEPPVCPLSALQGSGRIPMMRKICFAVGGIPYQTTAAAIGISLQIFLLDVVKVKLITVT